MSTSPSNPPPKPIPIARPVRGLALPAVEVDDQDLALAPPSFWGWQGWGWSLGGHGLLLVILALWVLAPKRNEVTTLDARLAGSDMGSELGLTPLGGLSTPITLPDAIEPPLEKSNLERLKPIELATPVISSTATPTNPGAGLGDGFGLAKFGSGGETVKGVEIKVGDPQFTLLWDSNADLDLHVIEPGGKEIYWNDTKGRFGGELDVDNTEGFGPENIYWLRAAADGSKDLGPGPPGEYKWQVEYYGGNRGFPVSTRWTVRVKHSGRVDVIQGRLTTPKARSRVYTLKMGDASTPTPPVPPLDR